MARPSPVPPSDTADTASTVPTPQPSSLPEENEPFQPGGEYILDDGSKAIVRAGEGQGRLQLELSPAQGRSIRLEMATTDGRSAVPVSMETRVENGARSIQVNALQHTLTLRAPREDGSEALYRFDSRTGAPIGPKPAGDDDPARNLEMKLVAREVAQYWNQVSRTHIRLGNQAVALERPGPQAKASVFKRLNPPAQTSPEAPPSSTL